MSKGKKAGIIVGCIVAIIVIVIIAIPTPIATPIPTYKLSVSVNPPQAGFVSPSSGEYESGVNVTLNATPASSGYTFDHWQGDVIGTSPYITVTMTRNMNITAHFSRVAPKLVILSHEEKAERTFPNRDLVRITVKGQAQNEGVYTIRSVAIVVKFYTRGPMDYQGWQKSWQLEGEASSSYYDIEPDQIFDFEMNGDFYTSPLIEPIVKYEISVVDIQY